ncbi:MAG: DNA polymerase IV [Spirochaetales bacterium]|nr:MAG: DNA polymerase IV [Spirochaetales bacterium]
MNGQGTKIFFHVDLDAFYASVEQNDNPALKGKSVIIGARPGTRGVVAACSYEARKFGVRSAMPISQAYRRCPDGVYLLPRMNRYLEVSKQVMTLFESFTPCVRQLSIDEATLDMTGTDRLFGPPRQAAEKIKNHVKKKSGLTLSIGIAGNRYIAKLASEYGKPDGLTEIEPGSEIGFLDRLELKDLWGLGKKTLERLTELNIGTVPQLRSYAPAILKAMLGKACGQYLHDIVRGQDPGIYAEEAKSRSLSSEITFGEDIRDRETIRRVMLDLCHQTMFRLLDEGCSSRTAFLKLRFEDFSTTTAQSTLRHPIHSAEELYETVTGLLDKRWDGNRLIRLIGLGFSSLEKESEKGQQELFEDDMNRQKKVEKTVLALKKKFHAEQVVKASLLKKHLQNEELPG